MLFITTKQIFEPTIARDLDENILILIMMYSHVESHVIIPPWHTQKPVIKMGCIWGMCEIQGCGRLLLDYREENECKRCKEWEQERLMRRESTIDPLTYSTPPPEYSDSSDEFRTYSADSFFSRYKYIRFDSEIHYRYEVTKNSTYPIALFSLKNV